MLSTFYVCSIEAAIYLDVVASLCGCALVKRHQKRGGYVFPIDICTDAATKSGVV
jgi:hypothetical protein